MVHISKGQIHWETITKKGVQYIVTSDMGKVKWMLYRVEGKKLVKLETKAQPVFETI